MISSHRLRLYFLALLILGGFGVLIYRLWGLQINRQEEFIAKLPETATALQRIPGPRGRIFDRNGIPLADNKANLEVGLNLAEVESYWKEQNPKTEVPKFEWGAKRDADTDIVKILNLTIFPRLDALSLYIQPTEKMIDDIRIWYRENRGIIPYPYQKALDRANTEDYRRFAAYAEYANELPGITLRDRSTRIYPLKALGAHVLGYVKAAGRERPPGDEGTWQFFENDDTGIAGVEKTLDADLRGKPGTRVYLKNEHGRLADEIVAERVDPLPGDDVYLTIDARIQTIAENAMRESIYDEAGQTGIGRGAISVIDPNTGEILAMASVPSYDPNIFIPFIRQADWDALQEKQDATVPMVSRSLSAYPPGSTFKIVTAIAASMEDKGSRTYNCGGSVTYGSRAFPCWKLNGHPVSHGSLNLSEALKRSCNCYFYQCGNAAGIDRIEKVGKMFGIGARLPIQLDYAVADEHMPGQKWWEQQNKGPWTSAKTANISIGQGEVQATPLEMSLVAAAVAANGKSWQPTLVHHQVKHSRNKAGEPLELRSEFKPKLRFDLLNMGPDSAKEKDLAAIRDGMWRVVNDKSGGTGRLALSEYGIAGKTGTAQKWRIDPVTGKTLDDHHTWFVAFAPYDNPKVAVCVVVPNGKSGGGTAAPIAKRVIERTLGLEDGKYHQSIGPLEPSKGHFNFNNMVTYEGQDLPVLDPAEAASEQGEMVDPGDEPVVVKPVAETAPAAAPRIDVDTRAGTQEADVKKSQFKKQPN